MAEKKPETSVIQSWVGKKLIYAFFPTSNCVLFKDVTDHAKTHRIIGRKDIVLMDYDPERLNIVIDADYARNQATGQITKVYFG